MQAHEIEQAYREEFEEILAPLVAKVANLVLSNDRVGLLYLADLITAMFKRAVDCLPDSPEDRASVN